MFTEKYLWLGIHWTFTWTSRFTSYAGYKLQDLVKSRFSNKVSVKD